MKGKGKYFFIVVAVLLLIGLISISRNLFGDTQIASDNSSYPQEKVYIALEGDGKIAVFDPQSRKVQKTIDLAKGDDHYMAHNVQVSPDGKSVWVTANAEGKHDSKNEEEGMNMDEMMNEGASSSLDEAIVIDPQSDTIIKRIPLAKEAHLAHVVVAPNNEFVYVTAQEGNVIYKINARTYEVIREIAMPNNGQPHGLRITPDGSKAFIAMMGGKAFVILDLKTDSFSQLPLEGAAVQTGVTVDGKYAFASVYDKKEMALYDIESQQLSYIALPADAKGPLQMYATPDSRFVYLADQGYYFNQPTAEKVYKIDLTNRKVVKEITVGNAPHGVVVSKNGKYAYITNLVSNDLSIIDTTTDTEVARIPVGEMPNGISIWSETLGGTQ